MPQALVDQLADDGVMVIPLGPQGGPQHIVKLTKSKTGLVREDLIAVRFVPLLPGQAHRTLTIARFAVLATSEAVTFLSDSQALGNASVILKSLFTGHCFSPHPRIFAYQ